MKRKVLISTRKLKVLNKKLNGSKKTGIGRKSNQSGHKGLLNKNGCNF